MCPIPVEGKIMSYGSRVHTEKCTLFLQRGKTLYKKGVQKVINIPIKKQEKSMEKQKQYQAGISFSMYSTTLDVHMKEFTQ